MDSMVTAHGELISDVHQSYNLHTLVILPDTMMARTTLTAGEQADYGRYMHHIL